MNVMSDTDFTAAPKGSLISLTTTGGVSALAVKRGDGSILEVKRAGASKKQNYSSLDAWKESFDASDPVSTINLAPKNPRVAPLNPPTEDVMTVRRIHNRDGRPTFLYCKVLYCPGWDTIVAETKRIHDDASTSESNKIFLKSYLDLWAKPGLFYREKKPYMCIDLRERYMVDQYVKHHDTGALEPINYCIYRPTSPFKSKRLYNLIYKIYDLPHKEYLHFRGKLGTSFAELGVPLGPDGKPEFWKRDFVTGRIEKIV